MLSLVDKCLEGFVNFNGSVCAKIISKERKRELKNNIVEWAHSLFEKMPISMKSIGILIRSFHMASPIGFFMIILLCRVRLICLFTLGVLVVIAFSFFFFDTCMISSLENRIIGDEFNIIDPVLELFNMDLNFMNRLKISYGIGCFYIVAMFCLYFVRFHRKDVAEIIKKYKSRGFKRDVVSVEEPVASQPVAKEPVAREVKEAVAEERKEAKDL